MLSIHLLIYLSIHLCFMLSIDLLIYLLHDLVPLPDPACYYARYLYEWCHLFRIGGVIKRAAYQQMMFLVKVYTCFAKSS